MAAGVNGASDSCTFTYRSTWIDSTFTTYKGYALIAYLTEKDPGGASILNTSATYNPETGVYFAVGNLSSITVGRADGVGWTGTFYTPTAYCVSIVSSVQQELRIAAVEAEYDAIHSTGAAA